MEEGNHVVLIRIPQDDGTVKQFGSRPLSFGLQKALARYSAKGMHLYDNAKGLDGSEFNIEDEAAVEQCTNLVVAVDDLYNEKTSIILRAFGNQFSIDELDNAEAEEVDSVIAKLQSEANGHIEKNG